MNMTEYRGPLGKLVLKLQKKYIDPYSPCVCGSGKKYKFCCRANNQIVNLPTSREKPDHERAM